MSTIQAIETAYKGYRFRSRLEARWAMFYDMVGYEWTYEPEPIKVDGEAYLPDFRVGKWPHSEKPADTPLYHEVKSLHERSRIKAPLVYLAGKMKKEHCWRGHASPLARDLRLGVSYPDLYEKAGHGWIDASQSVQMGGASFRLIGPFPASCDHGCAHHPGSAHMSETCSQDVGTKDILNTCVTTIAHADVFCAHISTPDAYGTLVEIGLARGQDASRPICVTVTEEIAERLLCKNMYDHYDDGIGRHDLWFAQDLATESAVVADSEEAQRVHGQFIRKHSTKEYRKIAGIGMAGHRAAITFGDPFDVANSEENSISWPPPASLHYMCATRKSECEAVRSHRFDGR